MKTYKEVKELSESLIDISKIPDLPSNRIQAITRDLLKKNPCIDPHTHFFDKYCTSAQYMILRNLKDFFGLRGQQVGKTEDAMIEELYERIDEDIPDWERRLYEISLDSSDRGGLGGIANVMLKKQSMEEVYDYYIDDSSLATYFGKDKSEVITTVLMMDFWKGWRIETKKSFLAQITELKKLSVKKPVLPFLFCDPRRLDDGGTTAQNLYYLFNYAFTGNEPFFGIKHYPALGYHPNDYRLWPIYEICEAKRIPVLTHCGGEDVSTDKREIIIFNGEKEEVVKGKNRKKVAYQLNDPAKWESVLERFPNLVLNIAHFGSEKTWRSSSRVDKKIDPQQRKETIISLMNKYPNVYADFSFTITEKKASEVFIDTLIDNPLVRERSMFGSDFWVVNFAGQMAKKQANFLDMAKAADKSLVNTLCKTNPMNYLFG